MQEAADRLKVHYMTAYRWVRKGELRAFKTGGRLRLRAADVEEFLRRRALDPALPQERPGRTDWPTHREHLHELLLEGDALAATNLLRRIVADGAAAGEVYLRVLTPALHRIGEQWAGGEISVAVEHRASQISTEIMARMGPFFRRRGTSRGTAVTMTPPGEQHGVASAMAAHFLRAAGYEVNHLGPDVPITDLRLFLEVSPTDVLCVSVTQPISPDLYRELVDSARQASERATVVVFGGQGVDAAAARAAGGRVHNDLAELQEIIRTELHPPA